MGLPFRVSAPRRSRVRYRAVLRTRTSQTQPKTAKTTLQSQKNHASEVPMDSDLLKVGFHVHIRDRMMFANRPCRGESVSFFTVP